LVSRPRNASDETPRRPDAYQTVDLPLPSYSLPARMPARTICELNAPARPRSPVMSMIATVSSDSCSLRIGRFGTLPAASAACRVIRRIAPA
jgi:hypothetical protein